MNTVAFLMLCFSLISGSYGIVKLYEERNPESIMVDLSARLGERLATGRTLVDRSSGRSQVRRRIRDFLSPPVAEPTAPPKPETWLDRSRNGHLTRHRTS